MLAQNFMTAEALGLTEEQHSALVKTLAFFERGEVPEGGFDMFHWKKKHSDCGTACCLGGWAEILAGLPRYSMHNEDAPGLQRLFFPDSNAIVCTDPAKGAAALRNYLTTGEPRWEEVMGETS